MYVYSYCDDEFVKVSMSSIRFLTEQLGNFIAVYEKKILLVSDEDKEKFNRLKEIYSMLKNQRYDLLINNPSYVINFEIDDEEYLPGYYPIWMFSMLRRIPIIFDFHIYIINMNKEEGMLDAIW